MNFKLVETWQVSVLINCEVHNLGIFSILQFTGTADDLFTHIWCFRKSASLEHKSVLGKAQSIHHPNDNTKYSNTKHQLTLPLIIRWFSTWIMTCYKSSILYFPPSWDENIVTGFTASEQQLSEQYYTCHSHVKFKPSYLLPVFLYVWHSYLCVFISKYFCIISFRKYVVLFCMCVFLCAL